MITVKEYDLQKTARKTADANNLIFMNGNNVSDNKLLFDFSFLDTLDIPESEKEAIKKEATNHCSAANRTAFVFYNADDWTTCNVVVDFNYHRVYNSKTWKMLYAIMEVKHVKYYHAERINTYDRYYTENVREFEEDSHTVSPMNDVEL